MTDAEKALADAVKEAHRDTPYEWQPGLCGSGCSVCRALDLARKVGRLEQAEAFVEAFRQWGGFGAMKMRIAEEAARLRRELDEATRG